MLLEAERSLLVRYARRLAPDGLAVATGGNLSVRSGGLVAITPSGIDYEDLAADHMCVLRTDGGVVEAGLPPSTELAMHLEAYERTGAGAVVHAHSPYATALSTLVPELPAVHYLVALLGGRVRVAPYATPGTPELAASIGAGLEGRSAVILQNHGTLAIGGSLREAYHRALVLEWLSALYYRARLLGEPRLLPDEEIRRVGEMLEGYERELPAP